MRKLSLFVLLTALLLLLSGCKVKEEPIPHMLIGVMITPNEVQLTGNGPTYNTLPAQITADEIRFPDVPGWLMYIYPFTNTQGEPCNILYADDALMLSNLQFIQHDNSETTNMTGTLTIQCGSEDDHRIFCINPVYTDRKGQVWLERGESCAFSRQDSGAATSTTLGAVLTISDKNKTYSYETNVTVSLDARFAPQLTRITEMNAANLPQLSRDYAPDELTAYTPSTNCAYLLVEQHSLRGEEVLAERMLVQPGDEPFIIWTPTDDNVLKPQYVTVNWP